MASSFRTPGLSIDLGGIAVAVADHSAARGEALAKAAIIAGSTDGAALLRTANVKAWMIRADRVDVAQESDQ